MKGLLVDSAIFLYALGNDHPLKAPSVNLLRRGGTGEIRLFASVDAIKELVFHRLRRTSDRHRAASEGIAASQSLELLAFNAEVLSSSLDLLREHPTIRGRDAVHAATARVYGIDRIVSPDKAFDGIPGLTRIDPLDFS